MVMSLMDEYHWHISNLRFSMHANPVHRSYCIHVARRCHKVHAAMPSLKRGWSAGLRQSFRRYRHEMGCNVSSSSRVAPFTKNNSKVYFFRQSKSFRLGYLLAVETCTNRSWYHRLKSLLFFVAKWKRVHFNPYLGYLKKTFLFFSFI